MSKLRALWRRTFGPILLVLALGAAFIWGVNIGRTLDGPAAPAAASIPAAARATTPATPGGEHVTEISPGDTLEIELEPAPTGVLAPPEPRLSVRVDIRDAISAHPVRGDVWLTTIAGNESEDRLIREQTSLVEFELPGPDEADEIYIKVLAPGYYLWTLGLRHQVEFDRVLPLPVMLEPLSRNGGSG